MTLDDAWTELSVRANLPSKDYLEVTGPAPAPPEDRRRFVRFRCRCRAILTRTDRFAAYTADISRSGMGIISPVQLFPRERIQIMTARQQVRLVVIWCRRLGKDCYHCGCQFQHGQ